MIKIDYGSIQFDSIQSISVRFHSISEGCCPVEKLEGVVAVALVVVVVQGLRLPQLHAKLDACPEFLILTSV